MYLWDLHVHTTYSNREGFHDNELDPEEMVIAAKMAGLTGVVVTEHDTVERSKPIEAIAQKHGLLLLRGMEYTSLLGHLLVYGIDRDDFCPPGAMPHEVIKRAPLVIPSHPFKGYPDMSGPILRTPEFKGIHAIEVYNGHVTTSPEQNERAHQIAEEMNLPGTAGSDAHASHWVGNYVTAFEDPFEDMKGFLAAMQSGRFRAMKNPHWIG